MKKRELTSHLDKLYKDTLAEFERVASYYGLPAEGITERHKAKARAILTAPDCDEAAVLAKKAVNSLCLTCLTEWAAKRIPGPRTPEALEKRAKQAEGLAKLQESKGNDKAAARQLKRAEDLRKEAAEMRGITPKRTRRVKASRKEHVATPVLRQEGSTHRRKPVGNLLPGSGVSARSLFRTFGW